MDLSNLVARLEAARQAEVEADGASFRLRLPNDHTWRVTLERHRDVTGQLQEAAAFRDILNQALIGWQGVTTGHLGVAEAGAAPEVLPFSAEARNLLLDHRQDIADALTIGLATKIADLRAAREAAAKNS